MKNVIALFIQRGFFICYTLAMQRIGILRGGISPEYHISLQTGANVQRALMEAGFEAIDMLLDKEGVLHIKGIPADLEKTQASVDVIWNALHGEFGEDGKIQELLDQYGIPYTGSSRVTSAMAFNKQLAKDQAKSLGINTPQSLLVMPEGEESVSEITQRIYHTMAPPWVLKPLSGGGSLRTYFAFTPLELAQFVEESVSDAMPFLVEQYIYGKEAAVGVIDSFRGKEQYVLPVVEIKSPHAGVLTHEARTSDELYAIAGGSLRSDEREELSRLAKELHATFGAHDYSQSEFIVDKQGKIWFIELDTHPYLHNNSPFLVALESVGSSLKEFVKNILNNKK
jgi:D-alanine-D-alanine ligase